MAKSDDEALRMCYEVNLHFWLNSLGLNRLVGFVSIDNRDCANLSAEVRV